MLRENRLYQADWLMRFYGFEVTELVSPTHPNLDADVDPKLGWALRNLDQFPVDVNTADARMLARIPGIGMKSVHKIVQARKFRKLRWEHLKAMGIAGNRARYFLVCGSRDFPAQDLTAAQIKGRIMKTSESKYRGTYGPQLSLFESQSLALS